MKRLSHVIQLNICEKLNTICCLGTNKCKMTPCTPVISLHPKPYSLPPQTAHDQPSMGSVNNNCNCRSPKQRALCTGPGTKEHGMKNTVHCTHIDNDKYMGIIKSWNLFLCAYNRGLHPCPCLWSMVPQRRISSGNAERFMSPKNTLCKDFPSWPMRFDVGLARIESSKFANICLVIQRLS